MRGIQMDDTSAAHCGDDEDIGESGEFVARLTKSFLYLEAVERASAQAMGPLVKPTTQRSPGHPARGQRIVADRRDSCLEEELDYRLQRMTDIARTLRGTCARQRDQMQALCASARRCHDDCVRLFADMTRHFRCRLAAHRKQVARVGAAMAVVESRNLELNRAFGEMLARATCTIDDLEGRVESSRAEVEREREEVEALRRRVAALENANRSARQETAVALTRLEESDVRASEVQTKLESAEKVSRYYELLLDASLRKLCMYEDPDEAGRKAASDVAAAAAANDDHVFAVTSDAEYVTGNDAMRMRPRVGGRSWDGRVRASSVSGLPERTVRCSSGDVARKLSHPTCYGHVTRDLKNGVGAATVARPAVTAMSGMSMTSLYATSDLSLPLIGLSRVKGDAESTATDVASSMTSLVSEPSPVVPKRKTKKKRRLTRQLRKSFSLEETEQMQADIASVQTTATVDSGDNTEATVRVNGCQTDVTSGKPTPKEDSHDPVKAEDSSSVLSQKQTTVADDATGSREGHTNESSSCASKDSVPGHNKPKRSPTFKGLRISGNAGFANFVRDVHRKLKRPRRSKTVELADLIGIRRPESESLNGDCNL